MRIDKQRDELQGRINETNELIGHFQGYLRGPKFQGYHPQDGSPQNYIATHEVESYLRDIRSILDGD